ncbi:hypothetical protein [Kosmotoga olearia]|uniref:Uncharacterized protein n=1 Tax=Kosmotoga olearia (strain ATCC BAA-1733 / DSM 21960 / TBF 19.5.1) TaxID=521045 RepID=C5CJ39_KOSOT|nr:hypothetical protein [Kosmotoga olearia]ACR79955.1 hypothetical protein Kole_1258 [Kosmotoga olearia TBF 19.5.1]MDK2954330.1 hypothetical protein [Kosmotoga sp.]
MNETKERHNIMMRPSTWKVLNELKRILGKSASEIIERSLWKFIESEGYNSLYFKIMSTVEPCDDEENAELTKILDAMTKEDLEIADGHELQD